MTSHTPHGMGKVRVYHRKTRNLSLLSWLGRSFDGNGNAINVPYVELGSRWAAKNNFTTYLELDNTYIVYDTC